MLEPQLADAAPETAAESAAEAPEGALAGVVLDETANVCLSGGAEGSDLQWGLCAGLAGHRVVHWSFAGHRTRAPRAEVVTLPAALLAQADAACRRANRLLRRRFPPRSPYATNLIRRDWFQVANAAACYGVGQLHGARIDGGTAWAMQMFIDRHDGAPCAAYFFDQAACRWHEWAGQSWAPIYSAPAPRGIWAGIGTRSLDAIGRLAIRVLLDYARHRPFLPPPPD